MDELSVDELDELIAEATVDAYGDDEQRTGLYTMIEEHLAVPFTTEILGVKVTVQRVDQNDSGEIVAICRRDGTRQAIAILDLPLPDPAPDARSGSRHTAIGEHEGRWSVCLG